MQALVLGIIYAVLTVFGFIASLVNKTFSASSFAGLVIWIGLAALIVYDTHCLTIGGCTIWSTVRTVLYSILPVIVILLIFVSFFSKPEQKAVEEKKQ